MSVAERTRAPARVASFHGVSVRTDDDTDRRLAVLAAKLEGSRGYAAAIALRIGLDAIERGFPIPADVPGPRRRRTPRKGGRLG